MALSGCCEPAGTSISIVPELADSSPARMRRSVVLPQPDGPTIMKNSPGAMSSDTWSTATRSPNVLVRSRMRMAGRAAALAFSTGRRLTAPMDIRGPRERAARGRRYCRETAAPTTIADRMRQCARTCTDGPPSARMSGACDLFALRRLIELGIVDRRDRRTLDEPLPRGRDEFDDVADQRRFVCDARCPQLFLTALARHIGAAMPPQGPLGRRPCGIVGAVAGCGPGDGSLPLALAHGVIGKPASTPVGSRPVARRAEQRFRGRARLVDGEPAMRGRVPRPIDRSRAARSASAVRRVAA